MRPQAIIPAGTPKCSPTRYCLKAESCARALIPYTKGLPVRDYTDAPRPNGGCIYFVSLTPAGAAVVPESVVHEAPQGLT